MASTTVTNLTTAVREVWETKVLAIADGMLVADKFAQTKVLGKGAGGTWTVNRILRVAKQTTVGVFGTRIAGSAAKNLVSNKMQIQPELWQDSFGFEDDVDIKAFFTKADYDKTIGQHMANSLDFQLMTEISTNCMRHRIDKDGDFQKAFTPNSATATTIVEADFDEADDFWNGGYITVTTPEGPGYDETQKVSDFVATSDTLTTSAWTNTLTTASDARITIGSGIVAGDKMTSAGLLDVAGLHRKLETEKFPGGVLHGFIDAAQEADLWTDTGFVDNSAYDASQRFANYRLVRWLDMELLVSSNIYRETVVGAASTTGVVYVAPIFGANSYCLIKWGTPGSGIYGVEFHYVLDADSENLTANQRWVSWKTSIGKGVLRSTSIIGLMTGATDQVLII